MLKFLSNVKSPCSVIYFHFLTILKDVKIIVNFFHKNLKIIVNHIHIVPNL